MLEDSDLLLANLVQGETVESLMKALGLTEKEAEYMIVQAEMLYKFKG